MAARIGATFWVKLTACGRLVVVVMLVVVVLVVVVIDVEVVVVDVIVLVIAGVVVVVEVVVVVVVVVDVVVQPSKLRVQSGLQVTGLTTAICPRISPEPLSAVWTFT